MIHLNAAQVAAVLGGDVNGNNVTAPGPNNHDKRKDRSMSITIDPYAPDGFLVHSHSEKNTDMECKEYVRAKLGLPEWKPEKSNLPPPPKPKVVCHYIYQDAEGQPYLRVTRMSDKSFRQAHWAMVDDISEIYGWKNGKPKGAVVPYRLPDIQARPSDTIWLVEGEKDADNLHAIGLLATTAPGGGSAFPLTPDFGQWFDGRKVVAIADNDATGAKWRERVTHAVADVVHLSMPAPHKDVSDWLKAGGTLPELLEMAANPPELAPAQPEVQPETTFTPTPFVWAEPSTIPRRPRIYGDHLFRKFTSLLVSPGGIGKSSLALVEALAMASGEPLLKDDRVKGDPLTVWYWNGEDPQEETQRRTVAAAKHHGLKPEQFVSRLYTDTGRDMAITLGQIARGEITLDEDLFLTLETVIIERGIDVFILDPFVSSHRMGENDNNAIDAIVKRLNRLADRCNCAVEIVHHVRKPSGGTKEQTEVNDARGASALLGAVRSARVLNVMSSDVASTAGVEQNERFSYFNVSNGKSNMVKRTGDLKWRHLYDYDLCNGPVGDSDHVGVVEHYELPSSLANVPANAAAIAVEVASKFEGGRLSSKSPDWFGNMVAPRIGLDPENEDDRAIVRGLIRKWIDAGVLEIEAREDKNRVTRDYVVAAQSPVHIDPEDDDDTPF